tara:strand:- start:330 stop:587 length:258 start_codon:yes stop_codon:yes gene_type:complete
MEQYAVFDRYIHSRDIAGHDSPYYGMAFNDSPSMPEIRVNILTVNPFVRKMPEEYGKRQPPCIDSDIFDDINELGNPRVWGRYRR